MIHIERGPAPEYMLSDSVRTAREKLRQSFQSTERQERFRFNTSILAPIRKDLVDRFQSKCAYCETSLELNSIGEIENFRPKGGARGLNRQDYAPLHYWWLAYEWDNLLLACQICNQKYKRDYFPLENESNRAWIGATGEELSGEGALLIDPCLDNPDEHLKFNENGYVEELTKKGKVTIEILGLNRMELVEERKQTAHQLSARLEVVQMPIDYYSYVLSEFLIDLVDDIKVLFSDHPSQEYAALQRSIFNAWYEGNSFMWEQINLVNKNPSGIHQWSNKTIASPLESDIREIDQQLSAIKRFSIRSIDIENFRSIEKISLNILPEKAKENQEAWLLLLGDNGIGKSSILQAVALALAGEKQLTKLELNVADFLKKGANSGKVVIQSFEHDQPVTLYFDLNGFRTDLKEAPTFVMAYGSTRLLPKGKIEPDQSKEPYLNIRNLFDYSVALNNPHDWLSTIGDKEFNDRVAPAFFDLLALRGEDRLWVNDGKINIQQFGDYHELEDNSDGYKTIVALVVDIMQTLSIDRANYHNSQGIVLIDEIGNHLHPRWRLKIVGALRKAFPKLQFIVTTHEPLCLRGLAHGEVVVLVRDQQSKIRALDHHLLPDHSVMRIEQLLTSDLFGLINVMDEETEKTYEEYYQLLSKKDEDKTEDDKSKIQALSSQLAGKEVLGTTPIDQAYYKMISDTFVKKIREDGFKTKEELKNETVSEVKDILGKQGFDWL
jgi:uncharacterized protein (TIGR02646 family)